MRFNLSIITLLFVTFITCFAAHGKQNKSKSEVLDDHQIVTEQWHLSLSGGLGVITNPLHGGDNTPLVLIPQVAFYAQQWFFDNGRIGYSFLQTPKHQLNLVSELNTESRFFINWHSKNIFALSKSASNSQLTQETNTSSTRQVNVHDVNKRRIAVDTGVAYHYINGSSVFSIQGLHDVLGVYNGFRAAMQWQYHAQIKDIKLKTSLGFNYKSAELNNYYYGLKADETQFGKIDVGSSWQPYAKIDARWPLSKVNSLRFHVAYYDYSAMDGSPLFEHNYSMTAFIGLDHTF